MVLKKRGGGKHRARRAVVERCEKEGGRALGQRTSPQRARRRRRRGSRRSGSVGAADVRTHARDEARRKRCGRRSRIGRQESRGRPRWAPGRAAAQGRLVERERWATGSGTKVSGEEGRRVAQREVAGSERKRWPRGAWKFQCGWPRDKSEMERAEGEGGGVAWRDERGREAESTAKVGALAVSKGHEGGASKDDGRRCAQNDGKGNKATLGRGARRTDPRGKHRGGEGGGNGGGGDRAGRRGASGRRRA